MSRLLARIGVDWVVIDCEHGDIDGMKGSILLYNIENADNAIDGAMHDAVPAVADAGVSPIIIFPIIGNVNEVKQVIKSAKFPPLGRRGLGSPYALQRFNPNPGFTEYLQQANESILTIVQIETKEAFEAVDDIAAIDGVDVLFIGPFDLGNNLGYPITAEEMAPQLKEAIAQILTASHRAGKKSGIYSVDGSQASLYAEQGFDMISITTDFEALIEVLRQYLSTVTMKSKPEESGASWGFKAEK
ncbi:hypothetical protein FSARC_8782 [Fusarium sarcochroum]|uniref:HpcH/HpaI aldolase/citrate lyase domain-containing protein n=1 Tax=Fusarium sarcochroum TaxID=1208366 RepID=A0A8H4TSN9_9HYPO|nr:hypothetical protein FSARC_8782 [Fusarium sarcochroum]